MKKYNVKIDLNQLTSEELVFLRGIMMNQGRTEEAKYSMNREAFLKGWTNNAEKGYREKL